MGLVQSFPRAAASPICPTRFDCEEIFALAIAIVFLSA
jgi:hypothetical protein